MRQAEQEAPSPSPHLFLFVRWNMIVSRLIQAESEVQHPALVFIPSVPNNGLARSRERAVLNGFGGSSHSYSVEVSKTLAFVLRCWPPTPSSAFVAGSSMLLDASKSWCFAFGSCPYSFSSNVACG
jgi:hypothetical protein